MKKIILILFIFLCTSCRYVTQEQIFVVHEINKLKNLNEVEYVIAIENRSDGYSWKFHFIDKKHKFNIGDTLYLTKKAPY
jgi:hypothetical protein